MNMISNDSQKASITGGDANHIETRSDHTVIAGGGQNLIDSISPYSAIGSGQNNTITSTADHATIPGGDSLIAQSYAQTVIGYHNIPSGSITKGTSHDFPTSGTAVDAPILIIGNGNSASSPSNAFEISYDGHTTVHDENSSGGATSSGRAAIIGTTYDDNVIYAWADVPGGIPISSTPITKTPNADFGVSSVSHRSLGIYLVTLNTQNNVTGGPIDLKHASITVTIENNDTSGVDGENGGYTIAPGFTDTTEYCGYATVTAISGNIFFVHTFSCLAPAVSGDCNNADKAFNFMLVGR